MFQKILVALDHSSAGSAVFQAALSLAKSHPAQLRLIHVLSSEEDGSPIPIPTGADGMYWGAGSDFNLEIWRQQWADYEQSGLEMLKSFAKAAQQANIPTEVRQMSGSAGRVICECAASWPAEVIVIGHRGRTGLKEFLLGSVSNYVIHHAACNILLIKTPPPEAV